jgi:hypothetical protein
VLTFAISRGSWPSADNEIAKSLFSPAIETYLCVKSWGLV